VHHDASVSLLGSSNTGLQGTTDNKPSNHCKTGARSRSGARASTGSAAIADGDRQPNPNMRKSTGGARGKMQQLSIAPAPQTPKGTSANQPVDSLPDPCETLAMQGATLNKACNPRKTGAHSKSGARATAAAATAAAGAASTDGDGKPNPTMKNKRLSSAPAPEIEDMASAAVLSQESNRNGATKATRNSRGKNCDSNVANLCELPATDSTKSCQRSRKSSGRCPPIPQQLTEACIAVAMESRRLSSESSGSGNNKARRGPTSSSKCKDSSSVQVVRASSDQVRSPCSSSGEKNPGKRRQSKSLAAAATAHEDPADRPVKRRRTSKCPPEFWFEMPPAGNIDTRIQVAATASSHAAEKEPIKKSSRKSSQKESQAIGMAHPAVCEAAADHSPGDKKAKASKPRHASGTQQHRHLQKDSPAAVHKRKQRVTVEVSKRKVVKKTVTGVVQPFLSPEKFSMVDLD